MNITIHRGADQIGGCVTEISTEKARTFKPADKLEFGNIKVTPIMIDHSAFDAYSFIIEANGKKNCG